MLDWLKKFEQSSLGMLFTDQHLSPSEIVRIAQQERNAQQSEPCATTAGKPRKKRFAAHADGRVALKKLAGARCAPADHVRGS